MGGRGKLKEILACGPAAFQHIPWMDSTWGQPSESHALETKTLGSTCLN